MWFEAKSEAERRTIKLRMQKQIARAMVNFAGFETTVHGSIAALAGDPLFGGALLILGLIVMHTARSSS
jgi:hypothetical protein